MVDDALRMRPENVMLPSFDELGAGPIPLQKSMWASQYTVRSTTLSA